MSIRTLRALCKRVGSAVRCYFGSRSGHDFVEVRVERPSSRIEFRSTWPAYLVNPARRRVNSAGILIGPPRRRPSRARAKALEIH